MAILDHLDVGKASVFVNLIPVVAVIGAFCILGDRLGTCQWLGAAIALGVYRATAPS